ncbi:hypothetical protein [Sulfuracidifex metallicus]|uniref:Uncharacterized protein n=1 Tax=Sulfuracidifex metallicus DSM 6482 = JCM 9184 TaxID=523847 RepID=A0A6A9QIL1_SULME|nr:hypothetical protein [Sulfuracidifex metallicus]MUN29117.1 hypothetical protein [Sulfuracidifex metallicus DSM 6482 = JCM 9184]
MTKEIEINYANVWSFLLNKGEAYVIRAEEFQPGEYICRHETESVQCIVDKVIEANPLVMREYVNKSGFSSLQEWMSRAAKVHMSHVRGGPFRKMMSLMDKKYLLHLKLILENKE